jgi:hypothetical protein
VIRIIGAELMFANKKQQHGETRGHENTKRIRRTFGKFKFSCKDTDACTFLFTA